MARGFRPKGSGNRAQGSVLIYSRKVSRTQLNMQSSYAAVTIVMRKRRREGLVQAHASSPKRTGMVLGNVTLTQMVVRPELSAFAERFECAETFSLRKEVIQPQVLLRLPCYDFTPIMNYTLGGCSSCELAHRLLVQPTFVM